MTSHASRGTKIPLQWGLEFRKILEERGVKRGSGGDHKSKKSKLQSGVLINDIAKELGVSPSTAEKRLSQADTYVAREERGVKRGQGGDHTSKKAKGNTCPLLADLAEELGVPERTAEHRLSQADTVAEVAKSTATVEVLLD